MNELLITGLVHHVGTPNVSIVLAPAQGPLLELEVCMN
jgi:hypothetical protein